MSDTMDLSKSYKTESQSPSDFTDAKEDNSRLSLTQEQISPHDQGMPSRKRRSSTPLEDTERQSAGPPTIPSRTHVPKILPIDDDSPFTVTDDQSETIRPNLFSPPSRDFKRRHRASTSTGRDNPSPPRLLLRCQSWDPDTTPTHSPTARRANRSYTQTRPGDSPVLPLDRILSGSGIVAQSSRALEPSPLELWRTMGDRFMTTGQVRRELSPGPPALVRTDGVGFSTERDPLDRSSPNIPEPVSDEQSPVSPSVRHQQVATDQIVFRTPIKKAPRQPSISPGAVKGIESDSASSRRSSLSDQNPVTPMPRTPISNIRPGNRMSLNSDATKSSERRSSLMTSPSLGIEWSPSMETPVKKRSSMGPLKTPVENMLMKLRGMPSNGQSEDMPEVADCDGWSVTLETPPRKPLEENAGPQYSAVDDDVLAKLRGAPSQSPILQERRQSTSSREGSFYSATSSLADDDTEYRRDQAADHNPAQSSQIPEIPVLVQVKDEMEMMPLARVNDSSLEIISEPPSVPPADPGLTLPSSFLDNIKQDDSQEPESPIVQSMEVSDSQLYDSFDELSDSALNFSKSTESNHTHENNSVNRRRDSRNTRSQRSDHIPENLPLDEPWLLSSPVMAEDDVYVTVKQEDDEDGLTGKSATVFEDDFDNIAFSQLDDGFNFMAEPTQRPPRHGPSTTHLSPQRRKKSIGGTLGIQPEAPLAPHPSMQHPLSGNEVDWLSRSNAMLGDMFLSLDVTAPSDYRSNRGLSTEHQPPVMSGFSSAGGKELRPISEASLARAVGLFAEDNHQGPLKETADSIIVPEIPTGDRSTGTHAPSIVAGFATAGGKKLAPTSENALKKAAQLFDDGDHEEFKERMDPGRDEQRKTLPPMPMVGFASAGSKKPVPLSKEAQERAMRLFEDDELSTLPDSTGFDAVKYPTPLSKAKVSMVQDDNDGYSIRQPSDHGGISSDQSGFSGFSSGKGKALAPVSKAARDHALSFLELEQPPTTTVSGQDYAQIPLAGKNRVPLQPHGPKGQGASVQDVVVPRQPIISAHMNNLMLKSLRANSSGSLSSQPGGLKPIQKTKLPFKSPMPFKSPLKDPSTSKDSGDSTEKQLSSTKKLVLGKKVLSRKSLHPQAILGIAPNATNPVVKSVQASAFQSLYNLKDLKERTGLNDSLGLSKRRDIDSLEDMGVDALVMTLSKAKTYRFQHWGVEEAYQGLLDRGASSDLLAQKWVRNHYSLVVWKLACYVRSWPEHFSSDTWFCPDKVLDQLAYRYEREINRAERPALRKIVEGDDSAARHLVLCIADITTEYSEVAKTDILQVTVTDGWYLLAAVVDPTLTRSIEKGRLRIGSKIHVCRAKLNGAENGAAILELMEGASSSVSLTFQANNTRLARWDAKLGFQRSPLVWIRRLRSITPEGGLVPGVDVVVLRKYPLVFLETLADGVTKIKRTAREEDRAAETHQESLERRYQEIVQDVEKEFRGNSSDSVAIREEVEARALELQSEATRNVTPMFTIRVGNYGEHGDRDHQEEALITFWSNVHASYQEGHRVRITSLTAKRLSREPGFEDMLQLAGTRMTTVQDMPADPETMLLTHYRPREITSCIDVGQLYYGAEVDLAVVVLVNSRICYASKFRSCKR
ncbi:Breast cancer 2, early onset [Gryganskiella cystojenkinii]|nr:Breast cancer 2, early onset [Gryganskiella cystojenkinii]